MRRAALAAAFLGLIGTGIGCRSTFGRCDCQNDPSCQPLPAYANPTAVVGPTQTSGVVGPAATGNPTAPAPIPLPDTTAPKKDPAP